MSHAFLNPSQSLHRKLPIYFLPRQCFALHLWALEQRTRRSAGWLCLHTAVLLALTLFAPKGLAADRAWKTALSEGTERQKSKQLLSAECCFREALRDVRLDKTSSADQVVLCLQSLANNLQMQEQTHEVIPLYKKSLHILEKCHGKRSESTVATLVSLADIFRGEAQWRISAKFYRRALAIVEKKHGRTSLNFADIQHRLGLVAFQTGDRSSAEKLYGSSLAVIMGQDHLPDSGLLEDLLDDYIQLLSKTYTDRKRFSSDVEKELLKDRLDIVERTEGVEESAWAKNVSVQLTTLPSAVNRTAADKLETFPQKPAHRVETAEPNFSSLEQINQQRIDFYERMIAIDAKTLGANHPSMARDLTGLAYVYLLQKQYDQAKILVNRALTIYKSAYGLDPLIVKRIELLLKIIDGKERSDFDTAPIKDYLSALPSIPAQAEKLEVALALNYLGLLCYSDGKIEDAQKIYAWAVAATGRSAGQQSLLAAACLNDYVRVLGSAGAKAEAARYEQIVDRILTRSMDRQAAVLVP